MTSIESEFKAAQAFIADPSNANGKNSNETMLKFYALFKQYSTGPNKTKAPSRLSMVKHAKWKAWSSLKNMSKENAMKQYIKLLSKTSPGWQKKMNIIPSKL